MTTQTEKKTPSLIAWHVAERQGKHYWTRIGAAWDHDDAKGSTLILELVPVSGGRIVLREAADDPTKQEAGA